MSPEVWNGMGTVKHAFLVLTMIIPVTAMSHDGQFDVPGPQPMRFAAQQEADSESGPKHQVILSLIDADTGAELNGLVRIRTAGGARVRLPELLPRSTGISARSFGEAAYSHFDSWSVICGPQAVVLPEKPLNIEAFSGLEYALTSVDIEAAKVAGGAVDIPLKRIYSREAEGYATGNVHLHLQHMTPAEAERYASEVALADGYDLVFFSYLERAEADEHYTSNDFTPADLQRFTESSGVQFGWGEEYRHNFPGEEGYGHVMFLDLQELILPASFGPDIMKAGNDDGTLRPGILQARGQDATILWCHNRRGHEDIPSWVHGIVDGQIVFDQGSLGGYEDGIYRYLNIGLKVPIATGTDWFFRDMALTYVQAPKPVSSDKWLAALRDGKSFITNGPLLTLKVNGKGVGETVDLEEPGYVEVAARAVGREDFGGIEVIANGEIAARSGSEGEDGHFSATTVAEMAIAEPTWFALRIKPFEGDYDRPEGGDGRFNLYGKPLFAHTSPIYVNLRGESVFIREAAQSLINELEDSKGTIRETGVYTNEDERAKTLHLYDEAIEILRGKLQ